MVHQSSDQLTRACLVIHRRFLEVGERIARLPEASQQPIILRLWQELHGFLMPRPGEEQKLTVELCQWVNKLLEAVDRMIDVEVQSLEAEAELIELGHPAAAESFRQHRHLRLSQD